MKYILFIFLTAVTTLSSQSIDVNETDAVLKIESSEPKGLLMPRMTEAQKLSISNAIKGLLVYQVDGEKGIYQYNGDQWISVGSNGPLYQASNGIKIDANNSISLYFPGQKSGDMFYFNGNNWVIIPKGTEGQKLKIENGVPTWID